MIKKIHHIGIVVKNLDETMKLYTKMLGKEPESLNEIPAAKIKIANYRVGETALEFLEGRCRQLAGRFHRQDGAKASTTSPSRLTILLASLRSWPPPA